MADSSLTLQVADGDYTDTQTWIDDKDSVTGTHTLNVEDASFSGALIINNGSTAGTEYIIKPQSGAKHDGRSRTVSGSGAELTNSSERSIWWFNGNDKILTIEDMVLKQTGSHQNVGFADAGATIVCTRCIFEHTGTGINIDANVALTITVQDCIVYGHTTWGIDTRSVTSNVIVGNTVITASGSFGLLPNNAGTVANNIVMNHSSEDYFGSGASTNHKNNIASDATADTEWNAGGGGVNNAEFLETGEDATGDYVAFVDKDTAGSEDFHLVDLEDVDGNNVALAGGSAGLGSGTDIDGETRDGSTPEVGADEVVVGETITPDKWHPEIQRPYIEVPEVINY